ncbi:DUF6159 family protein [uncultured Thermanaerothrix sp.]|uniref:DUF6159 family protein n=1 Tax=uncultured Thermanaerothrix sp. TaxID=1195149 RepID=UPI00260A87EA|nr:DUF6159 family protein [uncultured Thermanaerothrix sp.]
MLEKLRNSWELVKASARVLDADKELLIFPIISAMLTLLVSLTFFLPLVVSGFVDNILFGNAQITGIIVLFIFYLIQYTAIFFMNTALVGAALMRLRGSDPTFRDGLNIAFARFGAIIGYAVIAATVGVLLKLASRRQRGLGRWITSLFGLAWNLATFLVVPVLAAEDVGPIDAIKRSAALLKKTWGEQIVGNVGLGTVFGLAGTLITLAMIPLVLLGLQLPQPGWFIVPLILVYILLLMLLSLLQSTLSGIYTAAVYQYAVTHEPGPFFDPEMIHNAFQPTQRRHSL